MEYKIVDSVKDKQEMIKNGVLKKKRKRNKLSLYNIYVKYRMSKMKGETDVQNKMKIISKSWRQMTDEDKKYFKSLIEKN
jgi:hypothetical protein